MNQKIMDALENVKRIAIEEDDKAVASAISCLQGTVHMGEHFEFMFAQMCVDFSQNMIELIEQSKS